MLVQSHFEQRTETCPLAAATALIFALGYAPFVCLHAPMRCSCARPRCESWWMCSNVIYRATWSPVPPVVILVWVVIIGVKLREATRVFVHVVAFTTSLALRRIPAITTSGLCMFGLALAKYDMRRAAYSSCLVIRSVKNLVFIAGATISRHCRLVYALGDSALLFE